MGMFGLSIALLAAVLTIDGAHADDAAAKKALVSAMGKLWVGIAVGPAPGPGVAHSAAGDGYRGVEVDLGTELAQRLGAEVNFIAYPDSDRLTLVATVAEWSVAFIPVDEVAKEYVDFGSAYILLQATFLVGPGSPIRRLADVDRPGVRVAGLDRTVEARAAPRLLKRTTMTHVKTADELLELLKSKKADAIALSREAAAALSAKLPGSRVLDGAFWKSYVAIAVPHVKERPAIDVPAMRDPAVLAYLNAFIDEAIASGRVRRSLDQVGMQSSIVPPPRTRP